MRLLELRYAWVLQQLSVIRSLQQTAIRQSTELWSN